MKKDRNCMGNNMGVQMYPTAMPIMPMPQAYPTVYPTSYQGNYGNYGNNDTQYTFLQQQINMLEERVNKLEGKANNNYSNKYNDSNYYML